MRLEVGAHVGRLAHTDLNELPLLGQWDVTMHGRTATLIDVKAFCSQWPEGLGVIALFRKERGNLWCELRPMLGQARVKDGWRAAGVGEARRAVIPAPGRPHTMLSFRRSSANSSSLYPPHPKHRVTVMSVMGPKEKTKS